MDSVGKSNIKPKTVIYFVTFFLTGLALLYEVLKQRGVNKIKAGYLKRLTKPLHTVGVIEENKQDGYVVTGGFIHTGTGTNGNHVRLKSTLSQTKDYIYVAQNVSSGYTDKRSSLLANGDNVSWCWFFIEYVVNARYGWGYDEERLSDNTDWFAQSRRIGSDGTNWRWRRKR